MAKSAKGLDSCPSIHLYGTLIFGTSGPFRCDKVISSCVHGCKGACFMALVLGNMGSLSLTAAADKFMLVSSASD